MFSSMPPFTLIQMKYFIEIAKLENMTAAAELLRVTQPTLSSAMKQLERSLGVQLFVRTEANRLRLTAAGRALLQDATLVDRATTQLIEHVTGEGSEISGELVVGVFSSIAPFRVPMILKEFTLAHPRMTLTFVDGNQSSLQDMLLDGRCDLAIMYPLDINPRISTMVLDRIRPYVLLSARHELAQESGDIRLDQLENEPYIMLDLPQTREHYLSLFTDAGVTPRVQYRLDSFESVRSFVGANLGYTILHQGWGANHTYSGGEVYSKRMAGVDSYLEIVLCALSGGLDARRSHAFANVAKTVFSHNPS